MSIRAILIDDEKEARTLLQLQIKEHCPDVQIIGTASSVKEGLDLIDRSEFNLLFLDVELKDGTGFDIISGLEKINFHIIFVTAYGDYALDAIRAEALDYILKPIDPILLKESISRVKRRIDVHVQDYSRRIIQLLSNQFPYDRLAIHEQGKVSFMKITEIAYLEADGQYTNVTHASGDCKKSSLNIGHYEEILPNTLFFRAHRSFLINLDFVKGINYVDHEIELNTGHKVFYSQKKKEELMERIKGKK